MRRIFAIALLGFILVGCGDTAVLETLGQIQHQPDAAPTMAVLQLDLPESAALQTLGAGTDRLYECDGFTLSVETLTGGDLTRTVRTLSGFDPEKLTILETATDIRRFDWVWSAVGDNGDLLCRAAVLDDGNYHYCVCVFAPAGSTGALSQQWNELFASLRLEYPQQ